MTCSSYLSGGKMGDFIQQMSIIYEKYLETHEKAILYITDQGDTFRFGAEKAYQDLKPILHKQSYIESFHIHQGELFDVDLTLWRNSTEKTFLERIEKEYQVEWGRHPWIHNIPMDEKWHRIVVISTTHYRFPDNLDWQELLMEYGRENMVFVSFEKEEHQTFITKCFDVNFYQLESLEELYTIINSCRLFVGSLSTPLSIAHSLHTPSLIGFVGSKLNYMDYILFKDIKQYIRKAYVLTTNLTSERTIFCKNLLTQVGFEPIFMLAIPHNNKILSNKISMNTIYEKILSSQEEWSYIFEDDINTLEMVDIKELIEYEKISQSFFYLGCCGPSDVSQTEKQIDNKPVFHVNGGYVKGHHAVAFSQQGIAEFLSFAKKEENKNIPFADVILEKFAQIVKPNIVRYDLESYIDGHRGLFFQDRKAFPSSIGN